MANPHPNYFSGVVTLAAGNNNLESDIIPTVAPGMNSCLKELTWRPLTGGPVAKASSPMTLITDGASYAVGDSLTERGPGPIPANKVNFFPTNAGDTIELILRAT